ncbi:unnamed protein product, partial [Prorocentrum cordatum]
MCADAGWAGELRLSQLAFIRFKEKGIWSLVDVVDMEFSKGMQIQGQDSLPLKPEGEKVQPVKRLWRWDRLQVNKKEASAPPVAPALKEKCNGASTRSPTPPVAKEVFSLPPESQDAPRACLKIPTPPPAPAVAEAKRPRKRKHTKKNKDVRSEEAKAGLKEWPPAPPPANAAPTSSAVQVLPPPPPP